MKNLLEKSMELTIKNIVKKSSRKSINNYIIDILKDNQKKTRIQLVNEITLLRLQETEKVSDASFTDEKFLEKFSKMNKTVKNGVDTSVSNSQNRSSFNFNPDFNKSFVLTKNSSNEFFLKIKTKK